MLMKELIERSKEQLADDAELTCKAIEAQLEGRTNPKEGEIIAIECKKNDIDEVYIRIIMGIQEKRRKSTKWISKETL